MIDCKLAKQLYKDGTFKSPIPVTKANEKYLDYPPLSELIEACGCSFESLVLSGGVDSSRSIENLVWEASGYKQGTLIRAMDKDKLIAVAKLYIKLKKKK